MKLEMRVIRNLGIHLMKFVCWKYVYDVLGSHIGAVFIRFHSNFKWQFFSHVKFAEGKGSYKAFVEFNTFKCFSVDANTRKSGFTHAHLCLECPSVDADTRKYGVTHALLCLFVDADTRKSGFTHALSRLECLFVDAIESKSGLTYVLSCLESKNG